MWLVTTSGFYSVIQWHDGRMAIRARRRADLTRLKKLVPDVKFDGDLKPTPGKDYRYRMFCSKKDWVKKVLPALGEDVDYGNFKSAVDKRHGFADVLSKACHQAWHVFAKMQPAGPYSSGSSGYPAVPKGEEKLQDEWERSRPVRGYQSTLWPGYESTKGGVPKREPKAGELVCDECGHVLKPEEADDIAGEVMCKDVSACLARMESFA